jgi:HD-GYP domain-containing protein (c-di-GMP phosphodiesterase class II)
LASDIYNTSGLLIAGKGTKLTSDYIYKLTNWAIVEIPIEELSTSMKEQQEQVIQAQLSVAHDRVVGIAENVLSNENSAEIDPELLQGMVGELDSQIELSANVLLNLNHMKTYDNYLFAHGVNVAILAMIIGKSLKLSPEKLKELGVAALLHDYGMIKLDRAIYDHDRKLTVAEWERIKEHSGLGYEMLQSSGNFSEAILQGILEHHERCDGSGYPSGKYGAKISLYGKIIAIADVYDACVSIRKHRPRLTPHEALKNLLSNSNLFDIVFLKSFLTAMAIYPIGSMVKLNSGETAKVVGINQGQPFRPEIRILCDRTQKKLDPAVRIDLLEKEYSHTYIMEILDGPELEEIYQIIEPGA